MSFHDDSHILSQLGILDSHERSPKRDVENGGEARENKQKFVDVKLTASLSDSEDDDSGSDILFDRNNLLSSSRRQNPAMIRGRSENQTVRFAILALLFLVAGISNSSSTLSSCSLTHEVLGCLWICSGMLIGSYIAKFICFRFNLMLFLLATLLVTLINSYLTFNYAFLHAIRGIFVGSVLYAGIIIWFALWRKQIVRFLILIMFFSAGGLLAMTAKSNGLLEATNNVVLITRSIGENGLNRFRRGVEDETGDKPLLPFAAAVNNSTEAFNVTEISTVKKPEVATGNEEKVKSKTEENAEKEHEIKKKIEEAKMADNSTSSTTEAPETTPTPSTTTSTTTTTPAPTTTSTKKIFTVDVKTRESQEVWTTKPNIEKSSKCPEKSIFLEGNVDSDEANSTILRSAIIFVIVIFSLSFLLCCLPCVYRADSRVRKLESDSIVGLGMRLRISLASIQTIVGFLQQLLHFHPNLANEEANERSSQHFMICMALFFNSLALVFLGRKFGGLGFVFSSYAIVVIGKIVLLIWSTSILGLSTTLCGLYSLWISLFLTIEMSLQSRSTVQLAYFIIAWIFGRIIACLFTLESTFASMESSFVFIFVVALGVLLFYTARLLMKATRLKEILDNSNAPIVSGSGTSGGEYISLTAQDVMDDESNDDEDEMDRSSMNLDYELEQLGLEPVGVGSRN